VQLLKEVGIFPVSLFCFKRRYSNLDRRPNSVGIVPVKLFTESLIHWRRVQLHSDLGIGPERKLLLRSSILNALSLQSEARKCYCNHSLRALSALDSIPGAHVL